MKLLRKVGDGESRREGLQGGRRGDQMETNVAPRPHVHHWEYLAGCGARVDAENSCASVKVLTQVWSVWSVVLGLEG